MCQYTRFRVRTSAAQTHGRYQEISNQDDTSSHTHARTHTHQLMSSIRMQPSLSLIIAQRKLCLSVSNNENTHCSIEYESKWFAVGNVLVFFAISSMFCLFSLFFSF